MVTFTILALILIVLLVITIGAIVAGGAALIIVFGDVIVCMAIIGFIMYKIWKRKMR